MADLHGDDRGSQRSPEQCRKCGAHAGHDHDAAGTVLKVQALAELVAQAAADLQCGTFASDGGAQKMRSDRGTEDQRGHRAGNALAPSDGQKNGIRPFAPIELLVEEYYNGSADRHQEDDPGMRRPQLCGRVDPSCEDTGDRTDERSTQQSIGEELHNLYASRLDLKHYCF